MKTITISSKNQIVIPSDVRKRLHVGSGDRLVVKHLDDSEVVLVKEPTYRSLVGSITPSSDDPVMRVSNIREDWR